MSERHSGQPTRFIDRLNPIDPDSRKCSVRNCFRPAAAKFGTTSVVQTFLAPAQRSVWTSIECHHLGMDLFCGARPILLWRKKRDEADKNVAVPSRASGGGSGTATVAVTCAFAKV